MWNSSGAPLQQSMTRAVTVRILIQSFQAITPWSTATATIQVIAIMIEPLDMFYRIINVKLYLSTVNAVERRIDIK